MKGPILDRMQQIKATGGFSEVSLVLSTNDSESFLQLVKADGSASVLKPDPGFGCVADWLDGVLDGMSLSM